MVPSLQDARVHLGARVGEPHPGDTRGEAVMTPSCCSWRARCCPFPRPLRGSLHIERPRRIGLRAQRSGASDQALVGTIRGIPSESRLQCSRQGRHRPRLLREGALRGSFEVASSAEAPSAACRGESVVVTGWNRSVNHRRRCSWSFLRSRRKGLERWSEPGGGNG